MTLDPDEAVLRAAAQRISRDAAGHCPDEGIWVELAAGRLEEEAAEALREHLAACPACVETARDARRFLAALSATSPVKARPSGARRVRLSMAAISRLAAVLVLATGAVLLMVARRSHPAPVAIDKAAYRPQPAGGEELLYRDAEGTDPEVEASFAAAMAPYERDDFAGAERELSRHLGAHPLDQRARFYRGVALLLLGRARAAEPELGRVVALASPALSGEARWYHALALLRLGDRGRARAELGTLASGRGPRQAAASRLLATTAAGRSP